MSRTQSPPPVDIARQLDLTGTHLIEASAGTGKTYTIAGLFVRLVVERGLTPAQILVMTFTRAATDELRGRLRRRLAACLAVAQALAGNEPDNDAAVDAGDRRWAEDYLAAWQPPEPQSYPALVSRLRAALMSMDTAAIYTIDAFCQRVLAEFAPLLEAATPEAELVPKDDDLIEDFAADCWLRAAGDPDLTRLALLQRLAATPQALAKKLAGVVDFAGEFRVSGLVAGTTVAAAEATLAAAVGDLAKAWRSDGEAASHALLEHLSAGHFRVAIARDSDLPGNLAALDADLVAGRRPSPEVIEALTATRLAEGLKKAAKATVPKVFELVDACAAAYASLTAAMAMQCRDEAAAWLAERKRMLSRVSYGDFVRRLAEGVNGSNGARLVRELRRRFPVAMLDEFQDTDQRQFSIFDAVYRDFDDGALYLVGDPKQAIYGFRGGDLDAYLGVAAREGLDKRPLERNFRSSPAMLEAIDAVFGKVEAPFVDPRIAFEAVKPGGTVEDGALTLAGKPLPAMTLWPLPSALEKVGDKRDWLAGVCAATVSELLREGRVGDDPVAHGKIAVLTKSNDEIDIVQRALAKLGIASACVRRKSVFASREANEFARVLDALLAPQSMDLARGALATRLLGRRLSDLERFGVDNEAWRVALDELADLQLRWNRNGVFALAARIAERHAARLLALADGERIVGNLLQLGEALEADARSLDGPRALRDYLAGRRARADETNEDEQLRLESDADRVQVMTIHGSKGLEFDVVLLPFLALLDSRPSGRRDVLDFHENNQRVKYWLLNDKDNRDDIDEAAINAARREAEAETMRKAYVGITRAVHGCWMSIGDGFTWRTLLGADADLSGAPLAASTSAIAVVADDAGPAPVVCQAEATEPLASKRVFTATIARDWRRLSFSALTRDEPDLAIGKRDEPEAEPSSTDADGEVIAAPAGTRFGTAVHAILEDADFAAWRDLDAAPDAARAAIERQLGAQGIAPGRGGEVVDATGRLVAACLNTPIVDGMRLADLDPARRRAEMEFDFGIRGCDAARLVSILHAGGYGKIRDGFSGLGTDARLRGLMNGIIDLTFVHDDRWYIVDYKTNRLGPHYRDYRGAQLDAAIAEHDYDLQYLIYAVALHRWLRTVRGDRYDYARDFGGVRYLFLRGMRPDLGEANGVFADRPEPELIAALDAALAAEDAR